jgi:hypothetical protein
MTKKLTTMVITLMTLLPFMLSCATPEIEPTTTTEPPIPAHYSTYTSEGLFSISYPPDWVPDMSIIEELSEIVTEWLESEDPNLLLEFEVLFMCGIPFEGGYYPNVHIIVSPRSIGYWTLDEILASDNLWCREHLQQYHENHQVKTVIDSKEAAISDWQDYDPLYGPWRYLSSYVIANEFVWTVTCACESEDFKDCEDTFYSIVRSLRILQ